MSTAKAAAMISVGEALIALLEAYDVEVVFGIPGVHTLELYRGLAASQIRHVTPRHEQGAGFMADGYARLAGKPGVCLVITGPGLTNAMTAMMQAQADSIPMLVISGVNARASLGHGNGHLHELVDQAGLLRSQNIPTHTLLAAEDLPSIVRRAFTAMQTARPGPVHIEIPIDLIGQSIPAPMANRVLASPPRPSQSDMAVAADSCRAAECPVILAGGGAIAAADAITALAQRLDAPVVTTINARGLLGGHALELPASPSLAPVRALLADADLVLAIGTQFGPTDYDIDVDGQFPTLRNLIRIDIDAVQLTRGPTPKLGMTCDANAACCDLLAALPGPDRSRQGENRVAQCKKAVLSALREDDRQAIDLIHSIKETLPDCVIVGDSTQWVYAGNYYCEFDRPLSWFNAATGFGTLGYAPPAAIGACLAASDRPIVCLVGDGGLQFTLGELGTAIDENTPIIFIVFNNRGYGEIHRFMIDNKITPIGTTPTPPDFMALASAYGLTGQRLEKADDLPSALISAHQRQQSTLIEISSQ